MIAFELKEVFHIICLLSYYFGIAYTYGATIASHSRLFLSTYIQQGFYCEL